MAMVSPPPPPETDPSENAAPTTWVASSMKAIASTSRFLKTAASEWLPSLLDQPTQPPFSYNARFQDEFSRASRLIVFVLIISGIVVGTSDLLSGQASRTETLKAALGLFIVSVMVALVYRPFSYISGLRIRPADGTDSGQPPSRLSVRQIAFTVLYTFVPWLPVFAFIRATVVSARGALLDFLLIAPFICFLYIGFNFSKAIKIITNSSWQPVWLSLLLPMFLVFLYIVASPF